MIKTIAALTQRAAYYSGVPKFLGYLNRDKVRVLMYHSISGPSFIPPYLNVTKENFEKHMLFLKKNYHVLSFEEFTSSIKGKKIKRNSVLLTFDDGFMDFYGNAYPILKKLQLPATVFIIGEAFKERINWVHKFYFLKNKYGEKRFIEKLSGYAAKSLRSISECIDYLKYDIDKKARDKIISMMGKAELKNLYLKREQVKEMKNISLGYHTFSHPVISMLSADEVTKEIDKNWFENSIGKKIRAFAYPFGEEESYNEFCISMLKKQYDAAFTTKEGLATKDSCMYALERISINNYGEKEFSCAVEGLNTLLFNIYKRRRFKKRK